jgi:hypothetical protein
MKISGTFLVRAAGVILVFGIIIQVLYDPISSAKHSLKVYGVQHQFPLARAKWQAQGITNYTFEIQGNDRSICTPSAIIEVKNDVVVRVETKDPSSKNSPAQLLSPQKWYDEGWGDEVFLCNYGHFTMTQIFDLLDSILQDYPSSIMQADFDPKYGFLTKFSYGIYVGYGLLKPQISNCCNVLSVNNFQPQGSQAKP